MLHLINYIFAKERYRVIFKLYWALNFLPTPLKLFLKYFFKKNLNLCMLPHLLHLNDMHWVFLRVANYYFTCSILSF